MSDPMTNTTAGDSDTALVLRKNPSHNVLAHIEQAKNSLAELATVYLVTKAFLKALQREGLGTISVLRAATYQPVIQAW